MTPTLRYLYLLVACLFIGSTATAQLTGTLTVPSTAYPTLASVITALNTVGVGTGGAVVNVTAANPQTMPTGGYVLGSAVLNASLTAAKPLTINGNNNVITATAGTRVVATGGDAILWMQGVDYVTIDGFSFTEAATNLDTTTGMEYGIAMVNLNATAPFDGCNRNTIKNCSISLNRTLAIPSMGISAGHRTVASSAALTITTVADQHSYNKFYGNNISNVVYGIRMDGYNDPTAPYAMYDHSNDVGGTSSTTGNTFTNFGGTNYTGIGAVTMVYQDSTNVSYNSMNDTANGGAPVVGGIWGIYVFGPNSNFTTNNNTIVLSSAGINTAYYIYGIYTNALGTNLVANNNTIYAIQAAGSSGVATYGIFHPNGTNLTAANNDIRVVKTLVGTSAPIYTTTIGDVNILNNKLRITYPSATSVSSTHYGIYAAGVANQLNINGNVFDSLVIRNTGTFYMIFGSSATPVVNINNNKLNYYAKNGASGGAYLLYNLGSPATGTSTVHGNRFSNVLNAGTGLVYGIYYNTTVTHNQIITSDTINNWVNTSTGVYYGLYILSGAENTINNNVVRNVSTLSTGTNYGIYATSGNTGTGTISGNIVDNFSNAGSPLYGLYLVGANTANVFRNNIFNLSTKTAASGNAYGIYVGSAGTLNLNNNFVSDIKCPSTSGTTPVYGIYFAAGTQINAYHNTVNLVASSTGVNFGATGIYYAAAVADLDLRNNIVRMMISPTGTGTTVALRRSTGTAGIQPANLDPGSNGNIYHVPASANAYFYGESATTTMVNGFNLTNDANFNASCGLYKAFMSPRETSSFTENNLTAVGVLPPTFAPTGTSFAKSGAVPAPGITTDYAGTTRPTVADIGALQFTGTGNGDLAGPSISYTALPLTTYCNTQPVIVATITDATGVNTTAGTAPRLYYKKSTDANAFGVANTSSGNGWKWVEATISGSTYTFTFDYSKLQAALAINDSITYFIIAQDTRPTPNISSNLASFASGFCANGVDLPAAAGPIGTTPIPNGYKYIALPSFVATASIKNHCVSGASALSLSPAPPAGTIIQWQRDNGTSTFTDIAGATTSPYTVTGITATNRFRAVIKCGTSVVSTSTEDTVRVNSPQVVTTTPASRCGSGTLTLGATGSNLKWYDAATGGTSVGTGTSFTTPVIGTTSTYYVTASTTGGSENVASPAIGTALYINSTVGWGLRFTASATATINSVDIKAVNTTPGTATIQIKVTDLADVVLYTGTLHTFPITATLSTYTIPVNITVPPGNYKMVMTHSGIGDMVRESSGVTFPYNAPSGKISITAGANGATTAQTTTAYYWFYNWVLAGDCESARVPVVATVTAPPPVVAAATPPAGICLGNSATISATSTNTGYGYSWSSGQTTASFTASPTVTTKYVVTATDPVTNCVAKDSVTVTVVNQTATITPSGTQTVCSGSVLLSANTGTGLTYQWFNGTSAIAGATNPTYTATTGGSYAVRVTNTASGCNALSAAVVVNVVAPPVSNMTPSGNLNLCSGDTLTLTGPTGTGYTYQWKIGTANATGASTGATYKATQSGAYTLVVSANGCSTTSLITNIAILPLPVAVMSPTAPATACDSVVLSSSSTGVTYQWVYNNAAILGANSATYAAPVTGNYSLKVTSNTNGCSASSSPVAITINQSPAANITYASPISFCEGGAVILNTYSGANLIYEWRDNNSPLPGATTNRYTTSSSGVYTVKVTNAATSCAAVSQPITVRVNPSPIPAITYNGVTNILSTTQPFAQYQWVLNGQNIGGATQRNYSPVATGAYHVSVTDTNGCKGISGITFVNSVGVTNTAIGKAIQIFPNPTNGVLNVKSTAILNLVLRDITGKIVVSAPGAKELNLENLADGMYMLYITDNMGQLIRAEKVTKSTVR